MEELIRKYLEARLTEFLASLGPEMTEVGFPIKKGVNYAVSIDTRPIKPNEDIRFTIHIEGQAKQSP